MKLSKPILLLSLLSAASSQAAVSFTFDTDLEGFAAGGDVTSATHSTFNGGSIRIEDAGGWGGVGATISLQSVPAVWAEIQLAAANGGTLTYDIIIPEGEQVYTSGPAWFETVITGNSTAGWDQGTIGHGLNNGSWPLTPSPLIINASIPIQPTSTGSVNGADDEFFVDPSGGWSNLSIGINNDNTGALVTAVVYFDNITITANQIPEPSAPILALLSSALLLRRRRR